MAVFKDYVDICIVFVFCGIIKFVNTAIMEVIQLPKDKKKAGIFYI